jgi:hypothetical protein
MAHLNGDRVIAALHIIESAGEANHLKYGMHARTRRGIFLAGIAASCASTEPIGAK